MIPVEGHILIEIICQDTKTQNATKRKDFIATYAIIQPIIDHI